LCNFCPNHVTTISNNKRKACPSPTCSVKIASKCLPHSLKIFICNSDLSCLDNHSLKMDIKEISEAPANHGSNQYFFLLFYSNCYPLASEATCEFRNFTRLAVFSGCLSICDVHIWAQRCKLWITSPPSFFVLDGIFLAFWKQEFFPYNFT